MRIGVLVRNLQEKGGIAVYAHALLENLLAIGDRHEWVIYTSGAGTQGAFGTRPNVVEVRLPCRNKLWWDQVQVARDANRRGLDLVYGPKMTLPFAFRGLKSLALHGAEQFVFPGEFPLADRLYVRTFLPRYARAADLIITPAESSRDDLARLLHVPPERFAVTPFGWKTVFAEPASPDRIAAVRARHGLEGDFLLHVGLLWGAKNFRVLPDVLDRVARERPVVLAHAGKASRWHDDASPLAPRDDFRELGWVPDEDLAALYQSAAAFVFPSLYEGFGIPLVEAMAAGCPIVTTDWGAMKEVCDGAALLVDSRDPDAIAAAILRLLREDSLREELRRRGRARAQRFTWRETALRTLAAFEAAHARAASLARKPGAPATAAPLPGASDPAAARVDLRPPRSGVTP